MFITINGIKPNCLIQRKTKCTSGREDNYNNIILKIIKYINNDKIILTMKEKLLELI